MSSARLVRTGDAVILAACETEARRPAGSAPAFRERRDDRRGSESIAEGSAGGHPVWTIVFILAFIVSAGRFAVLVGWDIRGWFASL
jgi:hypothetical protein